ncbi:small heat shock protein HspH [Labrys miyagiensis]|uniref:Small heat shock protein HspH n=1 Tax=Labrys miyagiensis TaxID=346912 RepID=A0ABQ6CG22_9HYPH|nr:Hsp20 family protein [Labrys miyagiensis]GLS19179.1 small heat shock protein HspH [Labrys miyagiensis]
MRTYDFAPFARSAIGFDRLFDLLNAGTVEAAEHFPPYDIVRTGQESFRIDLAVAGFTPDDIALTAQQNLLTIVGRKVGEKESSDYLYRGISAKAFERRFNLADHIEVESATFENGLLQINLVQRIPEAMKPRRIDVRAPSSPVPAVPPKAA